MMDELRYYLNHGLSHAIAGMSSLDTMDRNWLVRQVQALERKIAELHYDLEHIEHHVCLDCGAKFFTTEYDQCDGCLCNAWENHMLSQSREGVHMKYRIATKEEQQEMGISEDYDVLLGPDGFYCFLGDPEDRTWNRDAKGIVDELNRLADEIERLQEEKGPLEDREEKTYPGLADVYRQLRELSLYVKAYAESIPLGSCTELELREFIEWEEHEPFEPLSYTMRLKLPPLPRDSPQPEQPTPKRVITEMDVTHIAMHPDGTFSSGGRIVSSYESSTFALQSGATVGGYGFPQWLKPVDELLQFLKEGDGIDSVLPSPDSERMKQFVAAVQRQVDIYATFGSYRRHFSQVGQQEGQVGAFSYCSNISLVPYFNTPDIEGQLLPLTLDGEASITPGYNAIPVEETEEVVLQPTTGSVTTVIRTIKESPLGAQVDPARREEAIRSAETLLNPDAQGESSLGVVPKPSPLWTPVTEALPPSGQHVLFAWKNRNGLDRVSHGFYAEAYSLEVHSLFDEDEDWYDERDGVLYFPEGWYETGWESERAHAISNVSHWTNKPSAPEGSD